MQTRTIRTLLAVAGLAAAMGLASPAFAQVEFKPFSKVENVCPDCEKTATDKVKTTDGQTIRCNIVAENNDFLVVERFGEVRGIPKHKVQSKSFQDGNRPSNLRSQDQLVLKNGHVLTGDIVDESDKPGHYQLKSSLGDFSYVVFKSEAKALYRDGSKKTIEMSTDSGGTSSSGTTSGSSSSGSQKTGESSSSESSGSSDDFTDTGNDIESPTFPE